MLSGALWLNIVCAFGVGGTWIALATLAADRFGARIGGFVGSLPSTAVVAFFFIGLNQSPAQAAEATTVFPLIMGFTGLFLVCFAALARKGFAVGLTGALAMWLVLSSLTVILRVNSFAGAVACYLVILVCSHLVMTRCLHLPSATQRKKEYTVPQILLRGLFGGSIIALAVFMSKTGGPVFGGLFAAFPAVFTSTLIINYRSQGLDFVRSMTRSMLVTGMITVGIYGMAVRYTYPYYGLIGGTILAYLISMVSAGFTFWFIRGKKDQTRP
ncbi:hypothetical protein AUK40_06045 [Candidatus Wirthbacteria bacterium CG2_30_54_11]|uniref:DUF3147 family protein n=1 Tax=Candidatus Wirthbacteria bacterium CG2_30_54_11 TaxID=1817892 RepID=A0A1J5ILV6_9BACT|nr:MAG: hypothetical protein AUK40_06045 [Candidatus Wirthbacteria bacterium CG2_30_54_11]